MIELNPSWPCELVQFDLTLTPPPRPQDEIESQAAQARRQREQEARLEIWNQLQAEKSRQRHEAAEADRLEHAQAQEAQYERETAAQFPRTNRVPLELRWSILPAPNLCLLLARTPHDHATALHLRGTGIRKKAAEDPRAEAARNAATDEWSREIVVLVAPGGCGLN